MRNQTIKLKNYKIFTKTGKPVYGGQYYNPRKLPKEPLFQTDPVRTYPTKTGTGSIKMRQRVVTVWPTTRKGWLDGMLAQASQDVGEPCEFRFDGESEGVYLSFFN